MEGGDGDDARTSYTSEFLESVSDLPIELKKSFNLIKDLDEYMHEMMDGSPSTDQLGVEQMKKKIIAKVPLAAWLILSCSGWTIVLYRDYCCDGALVVWRETGAAYQRDGQGWA